MYSSIKSILKSKIAWSYIVVTLFFTLGVFAFQLTNGAQLEYRYYLTNYQRFERLQGNDEAGKEWLRQMSTPHGFTSFITLSNDTEKHRQIPLMLMIVLLTLPLTLSGKYKNSNDVAAGAAVTLLLGFLLETAFQFNWYGDLGFHPEWFFPVWFIFLQPEVLFVVVMFFEMIGLSFALRSRFEKLRLLELRSSN